MNESVEIRSSQVSGVDFEQRIITLIAVPYDEEAVVEYRGQILRESVDPGAFDGIETRSQHVTANRDHQPERTIGKALSYDTRDSRGLIANVHVSRTPLGDETLQLAADGVLKASVGMLVRTIDQTIKDGRRRVHRAFLDHLALTPSPAYAGANVLAVRQAQQVDGEVVATPNLDWAVEVAREAQRLADEVTALL